MANISDDLADIAISRSLVLQRYANGLSKQVADHYTAMIDDIQTTILKSGNISNRLRQTIKDIKEQLSVPNFDNDLKELAQAEVNYTQKAYNSVIGIDLFKNIPPESAMSAILNTSLIEGATISAWLKDLEASQAFDVERAVKLGMTLGETNAQLANRLKSTMELSMRNAQSIVITATSAVANKARMDFYSANDEVLKGYQSLTVLDGKTSDICISYSGSKYDINFKPIGNSKPYRPTPRHFRCRSTHIPILKTWKELGIDEDELPTGTQSSDAGYLPQDYTFNDFLKTKTKEYQNDVLGVGKAQLWRDGKITLSQLVNQQGRSLSLRELKAISGEAVAVAKAVKVPDISFGYGGKFDGYVKDIRAEAKMVIDRLPKPYEIKDKGVRKGSYYQSDRNITDGKTGSLISRKEHGQRTFLHEYGHHIDYNISKNSGNGVFVIQRSMDKDFVVARRLDIEHLKNLYKDKNLFKELSEKWKKREEFNGASDIFDSFAGGKFYKDYGMHGHGVKYYKSTENKMAETFAQLFEGYANGGKTWENIVEHYPNQSKLFEEIINDSIK